MPGLETILHEALALVDECLDKGLFFKKDLLPLLKRREAITDGSDKALFVAKSNGDSMSTYKEPEEKKEEAPAPVKKQEPPKPLNPIDIDGDDDELPF